MTPHDLRPASTRRIRRTLATAAFVGLITVISTGGSSPAIAQDATQSSRSGIDRAMQVVALRYADAEEIADVLASGGEFRMLGLAADRRTNSLIVSGPEESVSSAVTLIGALDRPVDRREASSDLKLVFYEVGNDIPFSTLQTTFRSLLEPQRGDQFDISDGGLATVLASDARHALVRDALEQIQVSLADRPSAVAAPDTVDPSAQAMVQLTWLVTDPDAEMGGREVSDDMAPVVRELESLGMTGWRELGRASVLAARDVPFSLDTSFGGAPENQWRMMWQGRMSRGSGDRVRLQTDVRVGSMSLETGLETGMGRRMVLGLTPMLDMHTVFVIELVEVAPE